MNPMDLYDPPSADFLDWTEMVVDALHETRMKQQAEAEAKANAGS